MRTTKVLSITFPPDLAEEATALAKKEGRTMSELLREAFRTYQRERQWDEANRFGRSRAKAIGVTEADVVRLIKEHRAERPRLTKPPRRKSA